MATVKDITALNALLCAGVSISDELDVIIDAALRNAEIDRWNAEALPGAPYPRIELSDAAKAVREFLGPIVTDFEAGLAAISRREVSTPHQLIAA